MWVRKRSLLADELVVAGRVVAEARAGAGEAVGHEVPARDELVHEVRGPAHEAEVVVGAELEVLALAAPAPRACTGPGTTWTRGRPCSATCRSSRPGMRGRAACRTARRWRGSAPGRRARQSRRRPAGRPGRHRGRADFSESTIFASGARGHGEASRLEIAEQALEVLREDGLLLRHGQARHGEDPRHRPVERHVVRPVRPEEHPVHAHRVDQVAQRRLAVDDAVVVEAPEVRARRLLELARASARAAHAWSIRPMP